LRTVLFALCCSGAAVVGSAPAAADANDGEFMGYRLNQRYKMTDRTRFGPSLGGNLLIVAERPVMPEDMGEVRLTTTLESHVIGFIEASQNFATDRDAREFARKYYKLLHAKYPEWQIDAGTIQLDETTLMPSALNMERWPYTIRIKIAQTDANDGPPFRVSLTLRYLFDSAERRAWNDLARFEQGEQRQSSQEQLLEGTDARGL